MLRLLRGRRLSTQINSLYQTVLADEQAFPKLQKFMTFCEQMERLADFEDKLKEQKFRRDHELRTCTFTTREPVKSVLAVYINYRRDYNCEHAVACLEWLADVLYVRGDNFFSDLSLLDLHEDWRFLRIIDDIRTGLKPGMSLPPDQAGKIMKALAQIGYRDSGLFKLIEERAFSMSTESFNYSPAGHHVYTGFETHPDFQSYVGTLLEWKRAAPSPFKYLEKALKVANQSNSFTKDFAAALLNVSSQYYEMVKAQHENPIFQRDVEVDKDLMDLQEILVRSGLMHPEDFDHIENFIDLDRKMKRAEHVFFNLQSTFPNLNSPVIESILKQSNATDPDYVKFAEEKEIPHANRFHAYNLGVFAEGASEWMTGIEKDRDGGDFPNEFWRKKGTSFLAHMIPEVIERSLLTPHLTKMWQTGLSIFSQLLPIAKSVIPAGSTQDLCLVLYGMARGRVIDSEFCRLIEETPAKGDVNTRERVKGIYGAALTGHNEKFAEKLLGEFPIGEVRDMDKREVTRLTWALAALGKEENSLFGECLKSLNDGSIVNKQLTKEMSELSHDIIQFIHAMKTIPRDLIPENFIETMAIITPSFYDPLKDLLIPAIRPLLGMAFTPEETKHYKSIITAHTPTNYPVDDMLVLNQKLAPVMLMGTDGFSLNGEILIGYARMRGMILNASGYYPLFVPVHCLTDINFSTGEFKLNKKFSLKDWVAKHFGEFGDYLAALDQMMEDSMGKLKKFEHSNGVVSVDTFNVLKELVVLYKLQDVLKLKTTPYEISEKVEEMKLQIVKIDIAYNKLPEARQQFFDNFPALIRQSYSKLAETPTPVTHLPDYIQRWVGVRQAHELPGTEGVKKDIDPELINHSFLWVANYFQYKDWEERLATAFPLYTDMTMQGNDYRNRTFFTGRRQLYGKTPNPRIKHNSLNSALSTQDRLIASLTNIKYELKRNFSDSEILDKVLNLELIEKLTAEHLGKNPNIKKKLLPRDPLEFVRMMDHTEFLKSDMDMFSRHYRRLHLKEVARDRLFTDYLQRINHINSSTIMTGLERHAARNEAVDAYMESYRAASRDDSDFDYAYADGKRQRVSTHTDPNSLKVVEKTIFEDEDFLSVNSDEDYLYLKRLKAEAKLIKASIVRKLAKAQPLSELQSAYLETWRVELKTLPLKNAGRAFLPTNITSISYADVPTKDADFFNGLRNVQLPSSESHSVSDLVLELSHFLDDEVIHRVEFLFAESNELRKWEGLFPESSGKSKLRPDWGNKELKMRNLELEEHVWLNAGRMTETDFNHFEALYGFQRPKTRYDRFWWPLDLKSWREFSQEANNYENRLDLMRAWYLRKEKQLEFTIPMGQFARCDSEIHADYLTAKAIKGKEALDRYLGKDTKELADSELRELDINMKMLDNVEVLWGIMYHPNASERTKEEIEAVMKKYNLSENEASEPLATKPISLNGDKLAPTRSLEEWETIFAQASSDYISPLLSQLSK